MALGNGKTNDLNNSMICVKYATTSSSSKIWTKQSRNNKPAESAVMSLVSLAIDAMVVTPFLDCKQQQQQQQQN